MAEEAPKFDPEGEDYDYEGAKAAGMKPSEEEGENKGHWGSVAPASDEDVKKHKLPKGSYVILKGRKHHSWDLGVAAEEERGSEVVKKGDRYYSIPKKKAKAGSVLYDNPRSATEEK